MTEAAPSGPAAAAGGAVRSGRTASLWAALRPRQWVKNLLVLAVPLAAGTLGRPEVLRASLVALAAFCLVSSATYLVNDVVDRTADRAHPTKAGRPIASGAVSVPVALTVATVLYVVGIAGAWALTRPALVWTLLAYVACTLAYTVGLKHEPVLELALLAAGFLLRAIAGGAATDTAVSQWFLIVAAFGSLFMAAGKRQSELMALGAVPVASRRSLERYSVTYLRFVWGLAAAVTVTGYSLWAFEVGSAQDGSAPWAQLSIAPFVLAVLRYGLDIDGGLADAPEDLALRDRTLQLLALAWLVLFVLGVSDV